MLNLWRVKNQSVCLHVFANDAVQKSTVNFYVVVRIKNCHTVFISFCVVVKRKSYGTGQII